RTLWRKKKAVIMMPGTNFPDRCVCCNEPALGFRVKSLHQGSLVAGLRITRGRTLFTYGLCKPHRRSRQIGRIILGAIGVLGGAGVLASVWLRASNLLPFVLLFCIATSVLGRFFVPGILVAGELNGRIWVNGCKRPFLDSLPELPEG